MSEFSEILKKTDELKNVKLESAEYSKSEKNLRVSVISSIDLGERGKNEIAAAIKEKLPFASVEVDLKKSVCDCDIAKKSIYDFICEKFPSVKGSVKIEDIVPSVVCAETDCDKNAVKTIAVDICAENEVCRHLNGERFFDELKKYLDKRFCENFTFSFNPRADENDLTALKQPEVDVARIEAIPLRYFKVGGVTRLFDDDETDEALYIADALVHTGETAVAGKVLSVRQRETKAGKPFYIVDISDGTGRISGTVFSTKEIIRKMEKVQEGSEIIAVGKCETVNGYHRFTIKSINYCEFPKNFVYVERQSRRPPETYLTVKPSDIEEIRQTDMFSDMTLPECFKGTSIVVVDLETTGTSPVDDRVTEIGAVKIVDGKITCKFATMVNPERKIPERVVELTGITDDMVADAPKFEDVAGDLYKFCYGSIIVAHNLPFDYTFIKNLSKPLGYVYENRGMDTLDLSRALVKGLPNYQLNTVCGHFGIEFLHHRAYSDALATAQMFIELIRIKGNLSV
ncbi:MAG: exonuclease domain-containing protein [Candidatus Borkfalkiaceae bacterium]|nr:exonuclease domain-containing protein [Christensenellaceae bacterium]